MATTTTAVAAAGDTPPVCVRAQQIIAGTELAATVSVHSDYETFVASKPSARPLTVQQYFSHPLETAGGMMQVVSCKMKTAGDINRGNSSLVGAAAAAGDSSCAEVSRQLLAEALASVPSAERVLSADQLSVAEEQSTYMGPMWLSPWPFQPLARDSRGRLALQSRALYVPNAWWVPLPARFKGSYYCHLAAPQFLSALIRGNAPSGL